jgi:hypothetical protein
MRRARYRAAQFFAHLWPQPPGPAEQAAVAAILPPRLAALWARQGVAEQAHSLRVLAALRALGYNQPELLAAALLHDVGKTRAPMPLWGRVAVVLAGRLWPQAAARWGQGPPRGWRRPFVTAAQHPQWGADLVDSAGAHPVTVGLVRRHQTPATLDDEWLRALQIADDDQ